VRPPDSASEDDQGRESKSDAEHDGVVPVSARLERGSLVRSVEQLDQQRSGLTESPLGG
jgi:hypothetical protein